jgi:hypothetical protein
MESTSLTIFHVIWLVALPCAAVFGWGLGRNYGALGALASAAFFGLLAHIVWLWTVDLLHRYFMRQIVASTNEELREAIAEPDWKFFHTMSLLALASRNEEVRCELPRILDMLESDTLLTRRYGWDALRIVFDEETKKIGDYDPRAPIEDCREHVAALRKELGLSRA